MMQLLLSWKPYSDSKVLDELHHFILVITLWTITISSLQVGNPLRRRVSDLPKHWSWYSASITLYLSCIYLISSSS